MGDLIDPLKILVRPGVHLVDAWVAHLSNTFHLPMITRSYVGGLINPLNILGPPLCALSGLGPFLPFESGSIHQSHRNPTPSTRISCIIARYQRLRYEFLTIQ